MATDTATRPNTSQIEAQIKNLRKREAMTAEVIADMDEGQRAVLEPSLAKIREEIASKELELRQAYPEFSVREKLEAAASNWLQTVNSIFTDAGIPMKKFPTPKADGTIRNAPEVPGTRRVARRTRRNSGDMTLDMSAIKPTIAHKFRNGDTITGVLDPSKVGQYDGKSLEGIRVSDMINDLYKVADGQYMGEPFYAALKKVGGEGGQVQSPSMILTSKTGTTLVSASNGTEQGDEGDADTQTAPAPSKPRNGRKAA